MDNQNRYEEVPQKENVFLKILKTIGKYFKEVWLNFIESFKYNDMKLASILSCIPGVFLGFFLVFHTAVVKSIEFSYIIAGTNDKAYYVFNFDMSSMFLFILMLSGILNLFFAVGMSNKKNLGSVVKCTIMTGIMFVSGALYLMYVFTYMTGVNSGTIVLTDFSFDYNWYISIASVIVSIACAIAGVVLGYINYDRTYEKVDR